MAFLMGMPGGSEWIVIIFGLLFFIAAPILAIVFYIRTKQLKKQITALTEEKNTLLAKLLDKK